MKRSTPARLGGFAHGFDLLQVQLVRLLAVLEIDADGAGVDERGDVLGGLARIVGIAALGVAGDRAR